MRFIENFSQNIKFVKYISVLRLLRRKQNTQFTHLMDTDMHNTPEFTNVIEIHQWNSMSKEKANKTTKDVGNSRHTLMLLL